MSIQKYLASEGYLVINNLLNVKKLHPNAEVPFKEEQYNVAWEITIIGRDENRVEDIYGDVNVFTTGISAQAPKNYHLEVVEHPQLYKTGYSLIGSPRIINPDEDGEILIPLYKFKESEDLELPFRAALLVLRQTEYIGTNLVGAEVDKSRNNKHPITQNEDDAPRKPQRGGRSAKKSNHMF